MLNENNVATEVWIGVGGAMLVLLRSIVDGTRRSAMQLLAGCVFGAIGAMIAGTVFSENAYVYAICGVAAIVTENVILGLFNASKEFRDNPREVFAYFFKLLVPFWGKAAGDAGTVTPPAAKPESGPPPTPPPSVG